MDEEKFWYSFWTTLLTIVIFCIIYFGFMQDRPVRGYYLAVQNHGICIGVDIDNCVDDMIPMNGIELSKIIQIIDSLNINLKK